MEDVDGPSGHDVPWRHPCPSGRQRPGGHSCPRQGWCPCLFLIGSSKRACGIMRGPPVPAYNTRSSSQRFVPKSFIMSHSARSPSSLSCNHPMSSRHSRRCLLADRVAARGPEMAYRCERCLSRGVPCKVDLSSGRCSECIRAARPCSLMRSATERGFPLLFLCLVS